MKKITKILLSVLSILSLGWVVKLLIERQKNKTESSNKNLLGAIEMGDKSERKLKDLEKRLTNIESNFNIKPLK